MTSVPTRDEFHSTLRLVYERSLRYLSSIDAGPVRNRQIDSYARTLAGTLPEVGLGGGRQHCWRRYREPLVDPARSENQGHAWSLHARDPGDPVFACPVDDRAGRPGNAEAVILE